MVIGIDLDGVVFDSEEYFRTYAHLYDLEIVKKGLIDKSKMSVIERHNWEETFINDFYEKYTEEILDNAPFKPGARYVIKKLKSEGHKLVCLTLRGVYRECEISISERRLNEAHLKFDKIIYNLEDKLASCLEEKIDIMIEDNPNNVVRLAKNGIRCIYMRGNGMTSLNLENVEEVENWAQVLDFIRNNI